MFKNITLEISLKSFRETSDSYIKEICEKVFDQWKALIRDAETVKILMWSSDGGDLLDYPENLDDEFKWTYMIGHANPRGDYPNLLRGRECYRRAYILYAIKRSLHQRS